MRDTDQLIQEEEQGRKRQQQQRNATRAHYSKAQTRLKALFIRALHSCQEVSPIFYSVRSPRVKSPFTRRLLLSQGK